MQRTRLLRKAVLAGVLSFIIASPVLADVFVHGYFRQDGTYVQPYWRSDPDGIPYNNFSYPGNLNPYTGKIAPGNPSQHQWGTFGRFQEENPWSVPSDDSDLFDTDD